MLALSAAELTVLDWIAVHCRTPWLDAVVPWITYLGSFGAVWIVLALLLLSRKSQRACGIQVALALIFSLLLCNLILKNAVSRIRPFELAGIQDLLIPVPMDTSFPSGHTSASFAAAAVLFLERHPLRWLALVLACLISLSRLYLYAHYPTDVAAGALVGVLCGVLAVTIWKKILSPRLSGRGEENGTC